MRFLANENFPLDAVEALRSAGHDVDWVRTDAPGSSDPQVLQRAVADERVLLTFDKDCGELAFHAGLPAPSGVVLFRFQAPSSAVLGRPGRPSLGRDRRPDGLAGAFCGRDVGTHQVAGTADAGNAVNGDRRELDKVLAKQVCTGTGHSFTR